MVGNGSDLVGVIHGVAYAVDQRRLNGETSCPTQVGRVHQMVPTVEAEVGRTSLPKHTDDDRLTVSIDGDHFAPWSVFRRH